MSGDSSNCRQDGRPPSESRTEFAGSPIFGGLVVGLAVFGLLCLLPASAAASRSWEFRTPGEAAYCRAERNGLLCVTPNDGFWIRISGAYSGTVRISKGYDRRWRDFRERSVPILAFGRVWISSDAAVLGCISRRIGLTCHHFEGMSFWLGRYRGYRIYRGPRGSFPQVEPFFRTSAGAWCGNSAAAGGGEPAYMVLSCWRARDGTTVSLSHSQRERLLAQERDPYARDYRPAGFRLLRPGRTFIWRCRQVNLTYADGCSAGGTGTAVFTCRATAASLRCENRFGRGFVIGVRSVRSL